MKPWNFYVVAGILAWCAVAAYGVFGIEKAIKFLIPALLSGEALAKTSIAERERILGATFSWSAALACLLGFLSVLSLLAGKARKAQIREGKI